MNSGNIHIYGLPLDSIDIFYMNSYWDFEYTKAVTLHCAKVGGGKDQGPATHMTHLVKSTFQFL